jgi:peptidoglycan/LPS O-acetylase OafA/YrhL
MATDSANPASSAPWGSRYELLDGIRGVAALAVVLHHLGVFEVGHFAVMVFFVISGYCITASAASCQRSGRGLRYFIGRRIKRIYPPYLLAVAFYALTRFAKAALGGPNDLARPPLEWLQNLTLTQWVPNLWRPIAWPSDNHHLFVTAFWSLNYEEQFYLVVAIGLALVAAYRFSLMAGVLSLAALGLAWNWSIPGHRVYGLFIEYWAHFALGACLYFVLCVHPGRWARTGFVTALLVLAGACGVRLLPWTSDTLVSLRAMVELAFLSVVTLGLFFLRPLSARISASPAWRPLAALGTISYSLYLIHQFNLNLVAGVAQRLVPMRSPHFVLIVAMVALHLGLATLFWYACERPFLSGRRAAPIAAPPRGLGKQIREGGSGVRALSGLTVLSNRLPRARSGRRSGEQDM